MVWRNSAAVLATAVGKYLLAAGLAATPALAQQCENTLVHKPENAAKAAELWDRNREVGCLGSKECQSEICQKLAPLIQKVNDGQMPAETPMNELIQSLRDPAKAGPLYAKLRRRAGLFMDELGTKDSRDWNGRQFEISPANQLFDSFKDDTIDYEQLWKTGCGTAEACASTWHEAADTATHSQLLARIIFASTNQDRVRMVNYLAGLERRWLNYLTGSRSQYPWELIMNGWRYRRTANLVEPPNNQFILFHPSAAFEISDREGSKGAASVVLEAFGWNSWKWKDDKPRQRFGASAIVSWRTTTALPGDNITGYGGMIHLPLNLSVGYVYRPTDMGRHSFLLGADVGKAFIRGQDARKKILGGR
jgi:hypothetical protein